MNVKVAVLLENGFEELEAMGPIALLRRGGLDVDMIGVNNEEQVTGRFWRNLFECVSNEQI